MFKSNFEMVKEFHSLVGVEAATQPLEKGLHLQLDLIREEYDEVAEAMSEEYEDRNEGIAGDNTQYLQHVAKEIADLLYVVYGLAHRYSFDIDAVFKAVHDSNCTKFCYTAAELTRSIQYFKEEDVEITYSQEGITERGKPIYVIKRAVDGKVLKGDGYKEPDLSTLVKGKP